MKLLSKMLRAILILVFAITVIGLVMIKISSSTILNESYILKVLQTNNYYSNIYEEIQSNFENYIGPSGLDENILKEICTEEDVQRDTETILANIYEGTNNKIEAESIKEKATKIINKSIQNSNVNAETQKNIDQFVEKITDEYINTISHTEYEEKINSTYNIITKVVDIAKIALSIAIVVILIILVLLNLKQLNRVLANIGTAIISSGIFCVLTNYIINLNVRVQNIKILNDTISIVIQKIIKGILNQIESNGIRLAIIGLVLVILGNLIQTKNTEEKKEKKWKN